MKRTFSHHLETGSGSTKVILTFFEDGKALIEFDAGWMSGTSLHYRLHWTHRKVSENYGILTLLQIERCISFDPLEFMLVNIEDDARPSEYPPPTDIEIPEMYKEIVYEYIQLPESVEWIADTPDLEEMKHFFSLARWHSTFDLILWLRFANVYQEGRLDGTDIGSVFEMLDKIKFAVLSEDIKRAASDDDLPW